VGSDSPSVPAGQFSEVGRVQLRRAARLEPPDHAQYQSSPPFVHRHWISFVIRLRQFVIRHLSPPSSINPTNPSRLCTSPHTQASTRLQNSPKHFMPHVRAGRPDGEFQRYPGFGKRTPVLARPASHNRKVSLGRWFCLKTPHCPLDAQVAK